MFQVISEDFNGVRVVIFEGTYEECKEFAAEEWMNLCNIGDTTTSVWVEA